MGMENYSFVIMAYVAWNMNRNPKSECPYLGGRNVAGDFFADCQQKNAMQKLRRVQVKTFIVKVKSTKQAPNFHQIGTFGTMM